MCAMKIIQIHRIHQKYKLGYEFFLEFQGEERSHINKKDHKRFFALQKNMTVATPLTFLYLFD